jgi:copper resistance protein B
MRAALSLLATMALVGPAAASVRLPYASPQESEPALTWSEPPVWSGDGPKLQYVLLDRLEWSPRGDGFAWDASALWGSQLHGVWLGSVGGGAFESSLEYLEFQALYHRPLGGGFDANAGLRWDARPFPQRLYLAAGAQFTHQAERHDLWFGAFGYLSRQGELSARFGGVYNRAMPLGLVLQPSFEINASAADVPELGLGRGFTHAEAGLRLRYGGSEKLAPYVGLSWERSLGRTARLAREAGEDPETVSIVLGLRSSW